MLTLKGSFLTHWEGEKREKYAKGKRREEKVPLKRGGKKYRRGIKGDDRRGKTGGGEFPSSICKKKESSSEEGENRRKGERKCNRSL